MQTSKNCNYLVYKQWTSHLSISNEVQVNFSIGIAIPGIIGSFHCPKKKKKEGKQ